MSLPTTKTRLVIHFVVRCFEILLLYGHFCGAIIFAGDLLLKRMSELKFQAAAFASPAIMVMLLQLILFTGVLVSELRNAGLPRVAEPTLTFRIIRNALRVMIIAGIVVAFLGFIFVIVLVILEKTSQGLNSMWDVFAALSDIAVTWLVLSLLTLVHFDWLKRLQNPDTSVFATVPAMVQHVLPNQQVASDLKVSIIRDSRSRIVQIWIGGLACVILGIVYLSGFFPELSADKSKLMTEFLVALGFYVWISVSMTVLLHTSARREVAIVNGTYTAVGRNRWVALYFGIAIMAGLVLALVTFATNMYTTVTKLALARMSFVTFGLLVVAWAPLLFYAALCMDIFLIHLRNKNEDQSICTRTPIPLTMGSTYAVVVDNALAYDADF